MNLNENNEREKKKIAFTLNKSYFVVVEIKKGEMFDLTSLNTNTVSNYLLKIPTKKVPKKVLWEIHDELKNSVKVLVRIKRLYVGLVPLDFDFEKLERKLKTEMYYYH